MFLSSPVMNLCFQEHGFNCKGIFKSFRGRSVPAASHFSAGILLLALFLSFDGWSQITTQTFNSSGTFTAPAGVTSITVEAWGGGGAGGGRQTNDGTGGGGAGGNYVIATTFTVVPGNQYTVGVGGVANGDSNAGSKGNPSFFGNLGVTAATAPIVADGGNGGGTGTNGAGGTAAAGISTGGTVTLGTAGANGALATSGGAGGRGANTTSPAGDGGAAQAGNANGNAGSAPGGGGGGARRTSGTRTGGNGAAGRVVLTYYYIPPSCTTADQNAYGVNSWIGYAYDGANSFTNFLGTFTETQNFDESFGGDYVNFALSGAGCSVYTETFSVRFRMALTVSAANCGVYPVTIGGDDGVRLSVDGGASWEINTIYNDHAYTETTQDIYFDAGTHNLVLEYYENATNNRVRFNIGTRNGTTTGGRIGSDQTLCQTSINPALLTSISPARNCAGNTPTYQWQYSSTSDFAIATNVGTNSATYDPPSQPVGTRYYRRRAIVNGVTVYSNTVTIVAESPIGDQTTAGNNTWIGYVYDGANNFSSANYLGYLTAAQTFDYSFCGDNCTEVITGCDFTTETFTVRYRMSFIPTTTAGYTFTIGADDGVRLSVDGGSTFIVSDWGDHGYQETSSSVINMTSGNTYNLVLEYYENGGGNRVRFAFTTGPLPVTWSFLDGHHIDGTNVLDWRTASEKNNAGFVVERSFNGMAFDSVAFVSGNGTTAIPQAYSFIDELPANGWNYYRLKQIDYDNAYEYSRIIPVYADSDRKPGIYPNPASASLYISPGGSHAASDAYLLNAQTGRVIPLIRDEKQPARYPLDGVPSGTYVVSFTVEGRRYTEKVVVVK